MTYPLESGEVTALNFVLVCGTTCCNNEDYLILDTNTDLFIMLTLHVRGKNVQTNERRSIYQEVIKGGRSVARG